MLIFQQVDFLYTLLDSIYIHPSHKVIKTEKNTSMFKLYIVVEHQQIIILYNYFCSIDTV